MYFDNSFKSRNLAHETSVHKHTHTNTQIFLKTEYVRWSNSKNLDLTQMLFSRGLVKQIAMFSYSQIIKIDFK